MLLPSRSTYRVSAHRRPLAYQRHWPLTIRHLEVDFGFLAMHALEEYV